MGFPLVADDALTCHVLFAVVAQDVAEEIVWAASRPPHVNVAEVFLLPVNQATPVLNYREPKKEK